MEEEVNSVVNTEVEKSEEGELNDDTKTNEEEKTEENLSLESTQTEEHPENVEESKLIDIVETENTETPCSEIGENNPTDMTELTNKEMTKDITNKSEDVGCESTEAEEGELDDSSDEKEPENENSTEKAAETEENKDIEVENNSPVPKDDNESTDQQQPKEIDSNNTAVISDIKEKVSKIDFDDPRPDDDEQLDYGEDELEERMKASNIPNAPMQIIDRSVKERSDGEVDSDSDGEIKSDDGDDFEEGETRDGPYRPPEEKKSCRFFLMGNCTWGDRCRYLHPGINDKGNYDMFSSDGARNATRERDTHPPGFHDRPPMGGPMRWEEPHPNFVSPPVAETAWEKGLRHAKELKKRALQRKVQEPDFVQKREVLSLNLALNEDRDMEFVDHKPLGPANKGFDPFQEVEDDEYAVPSAEEIRRQGRFLRDRPRRPPPPHRHPGDKERRLPPPDHMVHHDQRMRDRRPPSPHRQPPPGPFPPDIRRSPPRPMHYDNARDHHPNLPPRDPGFIPHHGDRRDDRERGDRREDTTNMQRPDHRPSFPADAQNKNKDDAFISDGQKDQKSLQNGGQAGRSDQWVDPWARARPLQRGRKKSGSSSSSGSSSGSSSRSSSRSSFSSHSSYSGSSRSSSRSSASSRSSSFSSHRDSSRSPSPSKGAKTKKTRQPKTKQNNANAASVTQKSPAVGKPSGPAKVATQAKPGAAPPLKAAPSVAKKTVAIAKKPVTPQPPASIVPKPTTAKKDKPKRQRKSSSSSEFSRSDSSASPSPSRGKVKAKSHSGSDTGSSGSSSSSYSSSSDSSSSDSDDDKPHSRKTGKGAKALNKGQKLQTSKTIAQPNKGKVAVPSKPGRKDVKMTIIDKPGAGKDRKRPASDMGAQTKKSSNRRIELLEQLRVVEDAIARKRAKLT